MRAIGKTPRESGRPSADGARWEACGTRIVEMPSSPSMSPERWPFDRSEPDPVDTIERHRAVIRAETAAARLHALRVLVDAEVGLRVPGKVARARHASGGSPIANLEPMRLERHSDSPFPVGWASRAGARGARSRRGWPDIQFWSRHRLAARALRRVA